MGKKEKPERSKRVGKLREGGEEVKN